jgi:hypothetical protein
VEVCGETGGIKQFPRLKLSASARRQVFCTGQTSAESLRIVYQHGKMLRTDGIACVPKFKRDQGDFSGAPVAEDAALLGIRFNVHDANSLVFVFDAVQ